MPKIVITEVDNTTPGTLSEDFDVVYIPGFVDTSLSELHKITKDEEGKEVIGDYIGIEAHQPTLFTSVKAFQSLCGKSPVRFQKDQMYKELNTAPVTDKQGKEVKAAKVGFTNDSVPFDGVMFKKGDADPSYVMAVELLNQGLNVLFERVNDDSKEVEVTTTPDDWSTTYSTHYGTFNGFRTITAAVAPAEDSFSYNNYYGIGTKKEHDEQFTTADGHVVYLTKLESAPDDWAYNYHRFYYEEYEEKRQLTESDVVLITPPSASEKEFNVDAGYWSAEYKDGKVALSKVDGVAEGTYYLKEDGTLIKAELTQEPYLTIKDSKININSTDYQLSNVKMTDDGYTVTVADTNASQLHLVSGLAEGTDGEVDITNAMMFIYTPAVSTLKGVEDLDANKVVKHEADISIVSMYDNLGEVFNSGSRDGLVDKGNYSIKYLTSGGYPTYEYNGNSLVTAMMTLAEKRGDCVAFIDHTDNQYRESNIDLPGSLYATVTEDDSLQTLGEYAAMFTPWATYNSTMLDESVRLSATYAYLAALADSIKTNAPWLAVAGAARGVVRNLAQNGMTTNIPNGAADEMQPRDGVAVNAITDIKPYGYTIWGNRTLKNNGIEGNLTATSFLNVRNLVSDVKKVCYRTARKLTFEQNNDILWVNFKGTIAKTLDQMVSGYGLSNYKIVRNTTREESFEKATLCATIYLYPVYPVEDFYIDIVLQDDEIIVE